VGTQAEKKKFFVSSQALYARGSKGASVKAWVTISLARVSYYSNL